jgi:hypothetical protein
MLTQIIVRLVKKVVSSLLCTDGQTERLQFALFRDAKEPKIWGKYMYAVAQLVEELRYMPEGRGFDSRWIIEIFNWLIPSSFTVALGSTQPRIEMSTRNISWGKGGLTNKQTNKQTN